MKRWLLTLVCVLLVGAALKLKSQTPFPTKTTQVMVMVSAKPGIQREQIRKIAPEEVRATVRLYLDGKIRDWYARSDGKGVILILNAGSIGEARTLTESLPFAKANLVEDEFTELGPLSPLNTLLSPAPAN